MHFCQKTKEKVKKELKKLMNAGIIEKIPANESAKWISPAGFMLKDKKGEKLHHVCDLHELNKGEKTDSSIFLTPNEVIQSLKSSSKFYIKVDLLQGYHQIELDTSFLNLFCFTLEDGLYTYIRAPIGYAGS